MTDKNLISKCGFFCGSCPTFTNGSCKGCRAEHKLGDCFTFDCVDKHKLDYCGQCKSFPCDDIIKIEKATVLDKEWLRWKLKSKSNNIQFSEVDDSNINSVLTLSVSDSQKKFVPTTEGILARAWIKRNQNAKLNAIKVDNTIVGLYLIYDLDDEPACYCLMELMIDKKYQNMGFGQMALKKIIDMYSQNPKYPMIELSVDKTNLVAIHTYKKLGFIDSGYIDSELPQYLNYVYKF